MKALILAAGRGSRLGQLTADRPKCMVALAGRPLLQWQRDALNAAGLEKIHVMTGYRGDRIDVTGLTLAPYPEWNQTNMVGTLWHARDLLAASPTLVSYSDIVYHPDLPRALVEAGVGMTMVDPFTAASADATKVRVRPLSPAVPVQLYLLSAASAPLGQASRRLVKFITAAAHDHLARLP